MVGLGSFPHPALRADCGLRRAPEHLFAGGALRDKARAHHANRPETGDARARIGGLSTTSRTSCRPRRRSRTSSTTTPCTASSTCPSRRPSGGARHHREPRLSAGSAVPSILFRRAGSAGTTSSRCWTTRPVSAPTSRSVRWHPARPPARRVPRGPAPPAAHGHGLPAQLADGRAGRARGLPAGRRLRATAAASGPGRVPRADGEAAAVRDLWNACLEVLGLEQYLLHPEELTDLSPEQAERLLARLSEDLGRRVRWWRTAGPGLAGQGRRPGPGRAARRVGADLTLRGAASGPDRP